MWCPSPNSPEPRNIRLHVQLNCSSLRRVDLEGPDVSITADELVSALCQCKCMTDLSLSKFPLHTHHVKTILTSCPWLVNIAVNNCGGQTIILGNILWFKRAGSQLQSLLIDYESLSDADDGIAQHLERLIAHHPWDCWETLNIWRLFSKCRTDNSTSFSFTGRNVNFFREHTDTLVKNLRAHRMLERMTINNSYSDHDDTDIIQSETISHIEIGLQAILNISRTLNMVSDLDVYQHDIRHHRRIKIANESDFLHIVHTCPNLLHFNLFWCKAEDAIADSGMEALFAGCPLLKTASFGHTPRVTKRALQFLVTRRLPLHELSFCEAAIRQREIEEFRKSCAEVGMLPSPAVTVSACNLWW